MVPMYYLYAYLGSLFFILIAHVQDDEHKEYLDDVKTSTHSYRRIYGINRTKVTSPYKEQHITMHPIEP